MITQELVCSLFDYRDGKLFWKNSGHGKTKGKEAGTVSKNNYRHIHINYKQYFTHRLIFLYHNGYLPEVIDHKDGNPLNNKIENLREATLSQNQYNRRIDCRNKTGVKNVNKKGNKYRVVFTVMKKSRHYGYYDTIEEAAAVAKAKRLQLHKEFTKHE